MHDIKAIRQNPAVFDEGLKKRGLGPAADSILELDEEKRALQTELQDWQGKRNDLAKAIGVAKRNGENADGLMEEAREVNEKIAALEALTGAGGRLEMVLSGLPNLPAADVPNGASEAQNKVVRVWGEKPNLSFAPKEHDALGTALGQMDFESAAKISGARFVVLKGQLARLERALASFMLDIHSHEFGYQEIVPPYLVRDNALFGTGQLPKFQEDLYVTASVEAQHKAFNEMVDRFDRGEIANTEAELSNARLRFLDRLWLIPTAEVPLTNLVHDTILEEKDLPLRFTAYSPCFRSEAGSAGKDTRGMIRQHQFTKVELVSIAHPDRSAEEHERMTACAETILQKLGLHYRVMLLCTGDMGFSANKTYDLEVWLPGQNAYREISSCSNCGDFQARRMKARFRRTGEKGTEFLHTLNGSALAIGRTMVAILENYQQADGSVVIPEVLRSYMGGKEKIGFR